jgi:uncharacterized repeat protein (TIGR03803 family)
MAGLTFDASGNLYGTTQFGGIVTDGCPCGTIFELSPPGSQGGVWTETILYVFQGGFDASEPLGGVTFDQRGNLYGTTSIGGTNGTGTIFELSPPTVEGDPWSEIVLHDFVNHDGSEPQAGLTLAANGAFFGTARQGGLKGQGTVFRLMPIPGGIWQFGTVHSFNGTDGAGPLAAPTFRSANAIYGTTAGGGAEGGGVVFQISSSGGTVIYTVLYSLDEDSHPGARLNLYKNALYGTTDAGGYKNHGTVFRLTR